MRWIMAAFFVAGGVAHLAAPQALLAITPGWVPFPRPVIFLTGIFELALLETFYNTGMDVTSSRHSWRIGEFNANFPRDGRDSAACNNRCRWAFQVLELIECR